MFIHAVVRREPSKPIMYTVHYDEIKRIWYVKSDKGLVPIAEKYAIINKKTKLVYSLPNNDKQKVWTKRNFAYSDNQELDKISKYWSKFYHNQRIGGRISNGYFYPNI